MTMSIIYNVATVYANGPDKIDVHAISSLTIP